MTYKKFRVWDGQCMIPDEDILYIWYADDGEGIAGVETNHGSLIHLRDGRWGDAEGVLMQYAGITDCKGTPIYEGDIVHVPGEPKAKVELRDGAFVGVEIDVWGSGKELFLLRGSAEYGHVVGNIYEEQKDSDTVAQS